METKSAIFSKINWTQVVAFVAMVLTVFGIDVPDNVKLDLVALITTAQGLFTWVFRTWFTTKLTDASIK